jgi:hypothetical protein
MGLLVSLDAGRAAEGTEKPEQHENKHHRAKNAAQASDAVATVGIISAAATEQKQDNYYD